MTVISFETNPSGVILNHIFSGLIAYHILIKRSIKGFIYDIVCNDRLKVLYMILYVVQPQVK